MAHKLLDGATAVGASRSIKVRGAGTHHTVKVQFKDYGVSPVTALVVQLQGSITNDSYNTGIITAPALAIGSTAEQVANGAFLFRIDGTSYSKSGVAAGTALQSGYTITTTKYGVIMVYIDSAGTITYNFPAVAQAYDTAAAAMAAADAMVTPASKCYVGRVLIYNNIGAAWDSLTDDLTNGSDVTNAVFMNANLDWYTLTTQTFDATDLANQGSMSYTTDKMARYVRLYLSTLTGTGLIDAWYEELK